MTITTEDVQYRWQAFWGVRSGLVALLVLTLLTCGVALAQAQDGQIPAPITLLLVTKTTLGVDINPAAESQTLTFTAHVSEYFEGDPATTGLVQFKDNGSNLGAAVAVTNGVAVYQTSSLPVGKHNITASYLGDSTYSSSSSAVVPEMVINCWAEFINGGQGLTINDNTSASHYPSTLTVSGIPGPLSEVEFKAFGLSHTYPDDIDMMLESPAGGNLLVMSDVGGGNSISNFNINFSDPCGGCGTLNLAPDSVALTNSSTYLPTNYGTGDTFLAPAPSPSASTTFASAFNNTNGNGTWKLWVMDDQAVDTGSLSSWALYVASGSGCSLPFPAMSLGINPNPSIEGSSVTFTATMTDSPATGTVLFQASTPNEPTINLGTANLVGTTATLTVSTLRPGFWTISAYYSGDSSYSREFTPATSFHVRKRKGMRVRPINE